MGLGWGFGRSRKTYSNKKYFLTFFGYTKQDVVHVADEERVTQDVVMQREVITDIGLRRPVVSWIGHQATLKKNM